MKLFRSNKLMSANCLLDLLASLSWPMPNLLPKSTRIMTRTNATNYYSIGSSVITTKAKTKILYLHQPHDIPCQHQHNSYCTLLVKCTEWHQAGKNSNSATIDVLAGQNFESRSLIHSQQHRSMQFQVSSKS